MSDTETICDSDVEIVNNTPCVMKIRDLSVLQM